MLFYSLETKFLKTIKSPVHYSCYFAAVGLNYEGD